MQIALGADHGGFELKEQLKSYLRQQGHSIRDLGTNSKDPVDYPKIARDVAELVSAGTTRFGIMVDGAGIGSAMVFVITALALLLLLALRRLARLEKVFGV